MAGVTRKLAVPIPTTPGLSQRSSVGVMGSVMAESLPGDDEKPSTATVRIALPVPEAVEAGDHCADRCQKNDRHDRHYHNEQPCRASDLRVLRPWQDSNLQPTD